MDAFGIGAAIDGAAHIYFRSARGTGRTTALAESLKDGDRVYFRNIQEADYVVRLCKELGVTIEAMVIDPKTPLKIFDRGTPTGRAIFDHNWLEEFYLNTINNCRLEIDHLQRESSNFGMAHVETKLARQINNKWLA